MKTLKEILLEASRGHWAIGHFNISELDQARAIVEACRDAGAPVMIGMSEGERKHFGLPEAVAIRDVFRKEFNIPVFLNADHTKSVEATRAAIDAGFDSVHIDLSALPFEQNAQGTKEIVQYARSVEKFFRRRRIHPRRTIFNFFSGGGRISEINIEGELGRLKGESEIQREKIVIGPEDYTDPEEAAKFVKETGVDRLAIAVGNIHGISLEEPELDIERIKKIRESVPQNVALVLHAGSGILEDQIKSAIKAGIANIHINTDLRVVFREELEKSMRERRDETAMYKLDKTALEELKKVVGEKLELFGAVRS